MNTYEKYTEFRSSDGHCWQFGEDILKLPMKKTGRTFDKEVSIYLNIREKLRFDEVSVSFLLFDDKDILIEKSFLLCKRRAVSYLVFDDESDEQILEMINTHKRSSGR